MEYASADLSPRERYKVLTSFVLPRPIAWVTSVGRTGVVNAAPFSFFNVFCEDPPLCMFAVPRLADAPFAMECKTWKIIEVNGDRVLIMGEGINFYIRDELWDLEKMRVHVDRYHPIGRMFADRYCRTDDRVIFPAAEGAVAMKT